jgi:hypothetical protein
MKTETITNCGVVLIGAITMVFCIVKSRALKEAMPFVSKATQPRIERHLRQHRALMMFFAIGYVLVIVAFALRLTFVTEFFVSMIFLFIAAFIFLKISIETNLLSEMSETLIGLVPICAKCKKIREPNTDAKNQESWSDIEEYISVHSNVEFTHGYCPQCYEDTMKEIEEKKSQT